MHHYLCFAIYDKVRGEKFGTHVYQLLEHKPLVILFARLSLFSLSYSSIPVTKSECVWPDYNGYCHTEWDRSEYLLHREGANPSLELSQLLDTLSNVPKTYFTTSQ